MTLKFIALLLLCQLIGEVFVVWSGLPVPGPVVGMALLFAGLAMRGGVPEGLGRVADGLLSHLSLLFVPAGVGVMLHIAMLRDEWLPILMSIVTGSVVSATSAVFIARWLGASEKTLISLAPKSVTAPVAMGITEKVGGLPSLSAVLVVLTGVLGAVIGAAVLASVRVGDDRARGLALGVNSHGIGTARAFQISEVAGAFSALGMGLMALVSAFALPFMLRWVFGA